jgi:hypothetical protein
MSGYRGRRRRIEEALGTDSDDAIERGRQIQWELLDKAGGGLTVEEVRARLGAESKTPLAVPTPEGLRWPACQFVETGVLYGLADVLLAMDTTSGWTQLSLLMSETPEGPEGRTLLDAVNAGDIQSALRAARSWGEQGAG